MSDSPRTATTGQADDAEGQIEQMIATISILMRTAQSVLEKRMLVAGLSAVTLRSCLAAAHPHLVAAMSLADVVELTSQNRLAILEGASHGDQLNGDTVHERSRQLCHRALDAVRVARLSCLQAIRSLERSATNIADAESSFVLNALMARLRKGQDFT